jgi:hypothetical protein
MYSDSDESSIGGQVPSQRRRRCNKAAQKALQRTIWYNLLVEHFFFINKLKFTNTSIQSNTTFNYNIIFNFLPGV